MEKVAGILGRNCGVLMVGKRGQGVEGDPLRSDRSSSESTL
jgi:hypothetical protein